MEKCVRHTYPVSDTRVPREQVGVSDWGDASLVLANDGTIRMAWSNGNTWAAVHPTPEPRLAGVPRSYEIAFPQNPTVGLCQGPYAGPGGGGGF